MDSRSGWASKSVFGSWSAGLCLGLALSGGAVLSMVSPSVHAQARPSYGEVFGLHRTSDPLALRSAVAYVVDRDTQDVLFEKNAQAVLPIASLTKLMTALVVLEARQPLKEMLTVTREDIDTEKGTRSRLAIGSRLSRADMLHISLMSSENRAANALGRHYPGGLDAFVARMNKRAIELGMTDTHFAEPTGLSPLNQSSARDLALLVQAVSKHDRIRELSVWPSHEVESARGRLQYVNSNRLVRSEHWDIGLQKTGYISEAGRCLVMQTRVDGRNVIMVFLDSVGRDSRLGDAQRVRRWLAEEAPTGQHAVVSAAATDRVSQ